MTYIIHIYIYPLSWAYARAIWSPKKSRFMGPIALVMKKIRQKKIMHGAVKFIGALIVNMKLLQFYCIALTVVVFLAVL